MRIDHVIYAVGDLDAAAARLKGEFGLGSVEGGRHPAWGTANRIVPLGDDYLELMTVADPAQARGTAVGGPMLEALAGGERLLGWAVATDEIERVAERLGLEVTGGSRTRPDGVTLSWRLAGVEHALVDGAFPFFIQWDVPADLHPGRARAEHRAVPRGIAWVEVAADEGLRSSLQELDLPVRIVDGPSAIVAAAIDTSAGEVVLR